MTLRSSIAVAPASRRDPSGWTNVGTIVDDSRHRYDIDLPTIV